MIKFPRRPVQAVILLPPGLPAMSLNDREHWAPRNEKTQALRSAAGWLARSKRLPKDLPHAWVGLVYRAKDRRARDGDNLVAMMKPLADGLTDYGLVPDDNYKYMTKIMPVIIPPGETSWKSVPAGAYALVIMWNGE